jgi:CubicO group peptidase (beta-lactamase class C family)
MGDGMGVMTLVEAGKLDLDAPVSRYLMRWTLPPSVFDNDGVTVRRLLSHMAGLTDDLGYAGFPPGTPVQPLAESLTHAADADPGKDGRVHIGLQPGSEWRYSGGGYTLLQLLLEDVTGESFAPYMRRAVLEPLGMTRSTFVVDDDTPNVAAVYDTDGNATAPRRYTALAAASLYTTAADMTRFIDAHITGTDGAAAGRGVLRPDTLALMRSPQAWQYGAATWGLGTILYAPNGRDEFIFGHDGNQPSINTAVRMDPGSGDGIVMLETGNPLLASRIAGEWVFWKTGGIDQITFLMEARKTYAIVALGWIAIVVSIGVVAWRRRPTARSR